MILFTSPLWLWALPPVFLGGVFALWRGRHLRQRVGSTLLWRNLAGEASQKKRRRIDPVWLMIFLAAILAALGLSAPVWRWGGNEISRPDINVVMRALPGGAADHAEIFVQVPAANALPAPLTVTLIRPDVPARTIPATADQLAAGMIIETPKDDRLTLRLHANSQEVATVQLARVTQPRLTIFEHGRVSPALRRVMNIQPGAANIDDSGGGGGATNSATVLLVGSETLAEETGLGTPRVPLPEHDALVIFTANYLPTALGITPGPAPAWRPAGDTLSPTPANPTPASIWHNNLPAGRYRSVTLTDDWTVLLRDAPPRAAPASGDESARMAGNPFVALRRDEPHNLTYVYIASLLPVEAGEFSTDPSFVILATALVNTIRPAPGAILTWSAEDLSPPPHATTSFPLTTPILLSAAALIVLATAVLTRRSKA